MIAYAAALMVMSQAAEPAYARADAACVVARVPVAQREAIATVIVTNPNAPDSTSDPIADAGNACGREGNWTEQRTTDAVVVAVSVVIQDAMASRLVAARIDPRQIDAWFARQPRAERITANMSEATLDRLLQHLGTVALSDEALVANAVLVGAYFGTLVLAERVRLGLPVE